MKNLVEEIDTKYCTRSSCNVEKDDDGNTLCTKKSNYRPQKTNTTSFGQQSFRWLGPNIWAQISDLLKNMILWQFLRIKSNFENCPRILWKQYVQGVGYIT